MDEEVHAYIVTRLSNHANPDEIIFALCNEHGMSWPEAEALVKEVQSEHGSEITRRQLPLLAFLAIGLMLGGIVMMAYGFYVAGMFWRVAASEGAAISSSLPQNAEQGVDMGIQQYGLVNNLLLLANSVPYAIGIIFTGAALAGGSYFGMKRVWKTIFEFLGL